MKVIGTSEYSEAIYVIPIVVIGIYFTFIYDLYAAIEFYYGSTQYAMCASVIGATLNILLNLIFIPKYGYIAAAYTTLVCYIVFWFMHYFFAKRVLNKQGIKNSVYDDGKIILMSVGLLVLCTFCMLIYSILWLRIIVIILICILVFKNRDLIKSNIKLIRGDGR